MISIVIIEYNSLDDIQKCIKSIKQRCSDIDFEIIVSSNSCYPFDKQEEILRELTDVRWCFNERNGGFAYGMNQGLKKAIGDYLVIMNPDVIIKGSLSVLTDFLKSHKEVGAIAPLIVGHNGEIQDSCRRFVTPWRFIKRQLRRKLTHEVSVRSEKFDYSKTQTVDCVIGAFIMVTREVYQRVGGLDDKYFMYAEDIDWCTRIWKAGYKVVYCPKVKVEYEGSRNARNNIKYAKIFIKSHIKYWKKHGFLFGYPKNKTINYD